MRKISELTEEEKLNLYRDLVKCWGKESPKSLSERLDIKIWALGAAVSRLRKAGIELPKMSLTALSPEFIDELKGIFAKR